MDYTNSDALSRFISRYLDILLEVFQEIKNDDMGLIDQLDDVLDDMGWGMQEKVLPLRVIRTEHDRDFAYWIFKAIVLCSMMEDMDNCPRVVYQLHEESTDMLTFCVIVKPEDALIELGEEIICVYKITMLQGNNGLFNVLDFTVTDYDGEKKVAEVVPDFNYISLLPGNAANSYILKTREGGSNEQS